MKVFRLMCLIVMLAIIPEFELRVFQNPTEVISGNYTN